MPWCMRKVAKGNKKRRGSKNYRDTIADFPKSDVRKHKHSCESTLLLQLRFDNVCKRQLSIQFAVLTTSRIRGAMQLYERKRQFLFHSESDASKSKHKERNMLLQRRQSSTRNKYFVKSRYARIWVQRLLCNY